MVWLAGNGMLAVSGDPLNKFVGICAIEPVMSKIQPKSMPAHTSHSVRTGIDSAPSSRRNPTQVYANTTDSPTLTSRYRLTSLILREMLINYSTRYP